MPGDVKTCHTSDSTFDEFEEDLSDVYTPGEKYNNIIRFQCQL